MAPPTLPAISELCAGYTDVWGCAAILSDVNLTSFPRVYWWERSRTGLQIGSPLAMQPAMVRPAYVLHFWEMVWILAFSMANFGIAKNFVIFQGRFCDYNCIVMQKVTWMKMLKTIPSRLFPTSAFLAKWTNGSCSATRLLIVAWLGSSWFLPWIAGKPLD